MVNPTTTIRISQRKLDRLNDYAKERGWTQRFVIDLLIDNIEKCATLTRVSKLVLGEDRVSEPVLPPLPVVKGENLEDLIEELASQNHEDLKVEPEGSTIEPVEEEEAQEFSQTDDIFDLLGGFD